MHEIRVGYTNGDSTVTRINGSIQQIVDYYLGKMFTFADESGRERTAKANDILFLDQNRIAWLDKEIVVRRIYLNGHFPVNVEYVTYCPDKKPMATIGAYTPGMFG